MRIAPSTERVPSQVNKFLFPQERHVISVRQHPARIIPSLVTAIGGLLAAVVIGPVVKGNDALEVAIWLLVVILMAQLALVFLDWLSRYLVITSLRLFICCGFLAPKITWSSPLTRIQDITFKRSIGGYGTLVLESEHLAIDYVPYPEQLYLEITGLLFREEDSGYDFRQERRSEALRKERRDDSSEVERRDDSSEVERRDDSSEDDQGDDSTKHSA